MKYTASPNLLLEALAYLGGRTNGFTPASLELRLQKRGLEDLSTFSARFAPFAALWEALDQGVSLPQETLVWLFSDLEGFPYNTTGSYSLAFLLYYPMLEHFHGDFDAFLSEMEALTQNQVATNLLLSLNLEEQLDQDHRDAADVLIDSVLSLNILPDSRLALLEALRRYPELLQKSAQCLRPVLAVLREQQPLLDAIARTFEQELGGDPKAFLLSTSSLELDPDVSYTMRPYLLGPDTNLTVARSEDSATLYCGVLRQFFQTLLSSVQGMEAQVFDVIKLLGDKTRFDILCFLRTRPAYGQELSDHFGLARNTIHHHMGKLLSAGLVTCTVTGNRVYYALDRERLERLLKEQREVLLG